MNLVKDWCSNSEDKVILLCHEFFNYHYLTLSWIAHCSHGSSFVTLLFPQLPGFRVFMIEKFATNCCLYSVLDKSFDLRDANSVRYVT